jgi:TolB-like protein/Tfp pilus assembly protein PilF
MSVESPSRILAPGAIVAGKYRIVEEIGHDGLGIVYKAEDIKLKRLVALRFLPSRQSDSPEIRGRFLAEAQEAAALSHPNVGIIHDVGEDEGRPFIAMDLIAQNPHPRKARPRSRPRRVFGVYLARCAPALAVAWLLALGFNIGGLRSRLLGRPPVLGVKLAVLPFANLTGNPQQEFFSDGLTQEINTQISQLNPQALGVIGNTSVGRYKKTNTPIDRIGRELGVQYVLEGGAQREGSRIRITVELVKVRDQSQIWSESFDREMSGILALQAEVARKVAEALALKLLPAEQAQLARTRAVNPEAYEAYVKGSQYWINMTPEDLNTAEKYFNLALEKQPDYAAAYAGLAWVWGCRNQTTRHLPSDDAAKAKAAALKAVELDETLADAHYVLAGILSWAAWGDPAEADREWKRAVELNANNAVGLAMYSHFLMNMGRNDEALARIKKALELDPFSIQIQSFYVILLNFLERYDEALAEARKALAAKPNNPMTLGEIWLAYMKKGMDKEAVAAVKRSMYYEVDGLDAAVDRGYAEGGMPGAVRAIAKLLEDRARKELATPFDVASYYVIAGDGEASLAWLERGYEVHDPGMPYLRSPIFGFIRSDPRFQDLMRKMKL